VLDEKLLFTPVMIMMMMIIIIMGIEGVVRGLEGIHLADRCILTKLE
jgi:hypothetical protein